MAQYAVVQTGGKQYLVKQDDEIIVDRVQADEDSTVKLPVMALFDSDKPDVKLDGKQEVDAKVIAHMKGDKTRVQKFKAKVRYRRTQGFRPQLTKLKISL